MAQPVTHGLLIEPAGPLWRWAVYAPGLPVVIEEGVTPTVDEACQIGAQKAKDNDLRAQAAPAGH
jgi:hypothetical protein